MRPIRRLALGLWLVVFLVVGVRVGLGWRPTPGNPAVNNAVDSADNSTVNKQGADSKKESTADAGPAVRVGDALPPLRLNDLRGQPRSLAEWSGRTLLVNFWATWCAPCRREMPLLQQFQESEDPARLQIVGIAIDRRDPVLQFIGETGVTYPNLQGEMDATRAAEQFAPAFALPLSVVAAPDGTVLAVHMGELRASDLARLTAVARGLSAGTLSTAAAAARLELGGTGGAGP